MPTWVAYGIGAAVGLLVGWWWGREVRRGMPWGFFVLVLVVAGACLLAPYVWADEVGRGGAVALRACGAGLVSAAAWIALDGPEDGPAPSGETSPEPGRT